MPNWLDTGDATSRRSAMLAPRAPVSDDLERAELLLSLRRPADAAAAALQHLARHPHDPSALRALALSQHSLGRPDDALATLRQAIAAAPDAAWSHYLLAWVLQANGRNDDAWAPVHAAVALDPRLAEAHELLACLHWRRHTLRSALDSIDRALALCPGEPAYLRLRAELLRSGDDEVRAIAVTTAALRHAPTDPQLLRLHGELAIAAADQTAAIAALHSAMQLAPHDTRTRGELAYALRTNHWLHRAIWRRFPRVPENVRPLLPLAGIVLVLIAILAADRAPTHLQPWLALGACSLLTALRWNSLRLLWVPSAHRLLHPVTRTVSAVQIVLLVAGAAGAALAVAGSAAATLASVRAAQVAAALASLQLMAEGAARELRREWLDRRLGDRPGNSRQRRRCRRGELLHVLRTDHRLHRAIWRRFPRVPENVRPLLPMAGMTVVLFAVASTEHVPPHLQPWLAIATCSLLALLRWNSLRLLWTALGCRLLRPAARITGAVQIVLLAAGVGSGIFAVLGVAAATPAAMAIAAMATLIAFFHFGAEFASVESRCRSADLRPWQRGRAARRLARLRGKPSS